MQNELAALVTNTGRLAGADRYSTSLAIAHWGWATSDGALLATGANFPDALAASVWAGQLGSPLLVVPPTCIPSETLQGLIDLQTRTATLIGGPGSLSDDVFRLRGC
jgi:putative cell wall-binding protein